MSAQNQKAPGIIGALAGMVGLSALAGVLVTVMVTPALAVTGMAASNTIGIFDSLPEYIVINDQAQRNALFAETSKDSGEFVQIATVYAENREEATWENVSSHLKDAVLAGEDRRFYEHNGVDVPSIVRAAIGNVTSGDIESGASTLTMQLVKNIFITEALRADTIEDRDALIAQAQEQSLDRKLKEAKLAIGLEKEYTKNEIMLAYLNIAGFGGNTYGVEAAAQQYFGVAAADVTIAQAASLIAIVQQPGARALNDPEKYPANQARRDFILGAMLEEGFITTAEHREAIDTPVDEEFVNLSSPNNGCIAANDYAKQFCDYVVKNVVNLEALGDTPDEREAAWQLGGYDIYTTLNLSLQQVAQDSLRGVVPPTSSILDIGSVATSVETGTGRIITMAQNRAFNDSLEAVDDPATTAINYATDRPYGGSSGFQTGSTYKIFALIAWLNEGRGLNEVVDASRLSLNQASFTDTCGGPHGGTWEFKNNGGVRLNATSVFNATVTSLNSAFAAMGQQLDQCAIRGVAEDLGVHRADGDPLQTNPSAVLGTNEIAPLSMAAAFAAIGNGGIFCEPIAVDRIVDRDGNELPGQTSDCRRAMTADVAAATAAPMQAVVTRGTATASRTADGVPLIAKTGSTDRFHQTWVVGSSTEVGTAVWVGNVTERVSMLRYPGGSTLRHAIFRPLMTAINGQYGGGAFPDAPGRLLTGSGVELPDVVGQPEAAARSLLEGLGFQFEVSGQIDSDLPEGRVASMSFAPGTLLARGMTISVETSRGNLINLPDVSSQGYSFEEARDVLADAGFTNVSESCTVIPSTEEPGEEPGDPPVVVPGDPALDNTVTAQNPSAGSKVKYEQAITLTVSRLDCS